MNHRPGFGGFRFRWRVELGGEEAYYYEEHPHAGRGKALSAAKAYTQAAGTAPRV